MIDHVSIGSHDLSISVPFYTRCLTPLGYTIQHRDLSQVVWGADGHWSFCIYPADKGALLTGERTHFAFSARSEIAVQAFYDEAIGQEAHSLRSPGPRPDINPQYFGTMVNDLEGHTIEVVYWRGEA